MSTIVQDLNTLQDARDDMKTALENKGMTVTNDIRTYAEAIANIPSGSGSGDVKLFDTVEHMQADPNPSEGDLAVVYREELTAVTADSEFSSCTFPNTVILPTAYSSDFWGMFRVVDESSGYFDGMVEMSSSGFRFNGYGESSEIRVEYESEDGITYTRTDGGEELQDFGIAIKYEQMEEWDDTLGYFMKIGGNYFEGMYENQYVSHNNLLRANVFITTTGKLYKLPTDFNFVSGRAYAISVLNSHMIDTIRSIYEIDTCDIYEMNTISSAEMSVVINTINDEKEQYLIGNFSSGSSMVTITKYSCNFNLIEPIVSFVTYQYGNSETSSLTNLVTSNSNQKVISSKISDLLVFCITENNKISPKLLDYANPGYYAVTDAVSFPTASATYTTLSNDTTTKFPKVLEYCINYAQLNTTADYVYEKTFYGKNGVESGTLQNGIISNINTRDIFLYIGNKFETGLVVNDGIKFQNLTFSKLPFNLDTSNVTNMRNMFASCTNLTTIPQLNTSNVTNMEFMFKGCGVLATIPQLNTSNVTIMKDMFGNCSTLTTIPLLNTSNVTSMVDMFYGCSSLTEIPLLDTSNVTLMRDMFYDCGALITIPQLDTSNVTDMGYIFFSCISLTTIPQLNTGNVTNMEYMFYGCTSLTEIPQLNTSKVTKMFYMFINCTSLTTIPQLDTSNVTNMGNMFYNCPLLSNTSLNNILAMCTNATKVTSYKTLKDIGLTEAQANICKTLSNYSAFTSAGWTTGY